MESKQIHVHGKVQGVSYRFSTQEKAKELGIKGWVRNEADGSVKIEASGTSEVLDTFITWCHHGPYLAHVTQVEVTDVAHKEYASFEIVF